jgi:hypothetical protein
MPRHVGNFGVEELVHQGKLVRTRSLTAIGRTPRVTSLPAETYRRALMDKLHEEVDELTAARSASGNVPTMAGLKCGLLETQNRPACVCAINQADRSLDAFDVGQPPGFVEEGLIRAVEAAEDLELTVLLRGDPVALVSVRRFGAEEQNH